MLATLSLVHFIAIGIQQAFISIESAILTYNVLPKSLLIIIEQQIFIKTKRENIA